MTSAATDREARRGAIAAAALVFAVAAPATYVVERLYEYARGQSTSPILILRTLDTVYYWRAGVAVWWGLTVAFIAYARFRRSDADVDQRARRIALAAAVVVPVVALSAWFFP